MAMVWAMAIMTDGEWTAVIFFTNADSDSSTTRIVISSFGPHFER